MLDLFSSLGTKHRLHAALAHGEMEVARCAAAEFLQSLWRMRRSQRKTEALRAERERLVMLRCVHKMQAHWRRRSAQRKLVEMKEQRARLRAEGAALMVQGTWRVKVARRKLIAMRSERKHLLYTGAVLMVQSAWRLRRAKRTVEKLMAVRDTETNTKSVHISKIAAAFRGYRDRTNYRLAQMSCFQNVIVTAYRAMDLNIGASI